MARCASSALGISTKPKPRERPVKRSVTTVARSTVPYSSNQERSCSLSTEKGRFPT